MFIVHVALQGCLALSDVPYGRTSDTGGHIRYLLDLAGALAAQPAVERQVLVTRRFTEAGLDRRFGEPAESDGSLELVRLAGRQTAYLSKEDLHLDLDALTEAFLQWIAGLDRRPDLIHAHYGEAGLLAIAAKRRFGVPFFFTAHSLGRVKREALGEDRFHRLGYKERQDLRRRIEAEEDVIAEADLIVASSRDEAEAQFGLYRATRPERVRINPPGCNLEAFRAEDARRASHSCSLRPFLRDPEKPQLLCLARPVHKKNLRGVVEAFGKSPSLRAKANLVIYAGTREDVGEMESENGAVLAELFAAIDRYDLWGSVALPKTHDADDVPRIYAEAAQGGGVFINAAFNEPFGLTLLEAAASGLPVVATCRGGPNDIVARCRSGFLVDPSDGAAIASAAERLLDDPALWSQCSQRGRKAVRFYDWTRHASDYLRDLANQKRPQPQPKWKALDILREEKPAETPAYDTLLLSDIDNTLIGDQVALEQLKGWLATQDRLAFGIATGRSLHSALDILEQWEAPPLLALVTSVGSEIYYPETAGSTLLRADDAFADHIAADWEREKLADFLDSYPKLRPQPRIDQRRFKLSYLADWTAGDVEELRLALRQHGLKASVIYSHGRFVDVLPARAGKGKALRWIAAMLGIGRGRVCAAGDSGNDRDMLSAADRGILVANHEAEIADLAGLPNIYAARSPYAGAIVEAMQGWSRPKSARPRHGALPFETVGSHTSTRPAGAIDQPAEWTGRTDN